MGRDATGGDGTLGKAVEDDVPVLFLLGLVEGDDRIAALVLELLEQNVDRGADLEFAEIDEFVGGNDRLGLGANVDDHVVLADFGDDAGDDGAFLEQPERGLGQQFFHY